jgi:hypothetical protein
MTETLKYDPRDFYCKRPARWDGTVRGARRIIRRWGKRYGWVAGTPVYACELSNLGHNWRVADYGELLAMLSSGRGEPFAMTPNGITDHYVKGMGLAPQGRGWVLVLELGDAC